MLLEFQTRVLMPDLKSIRGEIIKDKTAAQDKIRRRYLAKLYKLTGIDTIIYASAFSPIQLPDIRLPNSIISITNDDIQGFMAALHGLKGKQLDLILHSPGGTLEAADQIVQYLRRKYEYIRAIVPQNAMSAATMIACACDEIVMGKHSAIGPIDPQITLVTENGQFTAPAQVIIMEYERAKNEVTANPNLNPIWATKFKAYPPGILDICETTLKLAKEKVTEWLEKYMLKDKMEMAKKIAEWLADFSIHKTHARPIGIEDAKKIGLKITQLESNQQFQEIVLSLYHSTIVTFETTNCTKLVENHKGQGRFLNIELNKIRK